MNYELWKASEALFFSGVAFGFAAGMGVKMIVDYLFSPSKKING